MNRASNRRRSNPEPGPRIIIACEGSKSEPLYFHGIRQALSLSRRRVLIVPPVGSDPRSVVRAAVGAREDERRTQDWSGQDTAWAVFDGDEHRANNPSNWNDALQTAQSKGIRLAISNPCFEFWYLLHFRDHTAFLTGEKARELLRQHVPNYERASKLYPEPLAVLTPDAVGRAKRLAALHQANQSPPHTNPCTGVAELVELLLALQRPE
jgi:RloB-like protein